jgi:predicted ATPase
MPSIKIINFGPIKEGYNDNDGFIPIDRFMAFIGNQGSGKSSIVKLISTFSWLEKALFQKKATIEELTKGDYFKMYCGHQQIENYFQQSDIINEGSFIEYKGMAFNFRYENNRLKITTGSLLDYRIPKITFIPAERNLLSVIEQAEKVRQLPSTLQWCLEEFNKACRDLEGSIDLPINKISFRYDKVRRTSFINDVTREYNLKLSEASSGIQSITPLFIVLEYLNKFIANQEEVSYSEEDLEKFRVDYEVISSSNLPRALKDEALKVLYEKYSINYLLNIIEELEQNLFPESQRAILNQVLEFTNNNPQNKVILTTHSPYIIGYMTLAMKAFILSEKIKTHDLLSDRLSVIVPAKAWFDPKDVAIYELKNGLIEKVNSDNGVISGKNYLNEHMQEVNSLFSELQDIEEEVEI